MYFIIYLSAGTDWFSETELKEILQASNSNNRRDSISGLLLYNNGNFIQLLEGEKQQVLEAFERIRQDTRHKSITPVASGPLNQRNFPEWSMGFKKVNNHTLKELQGMFNNDKDPLLNVNNHMSVNMLKAFMRTAKMSF